MYYIPDTKMELSGNSGEVTSWALPILLSLLGEDGGGEERGRGRFCEGFWAQERKGGGGSILPFQFRAQ